jgi:hypothetical protein
MLWRFLIWELLWKLWVTTADHSLLLVLYLYNSFFSRYVTSKMKNLSVMLLAGWFPQLFWTFCDHNSTSHLLNLRVSEQWSPVLICGCYSSFAEWSPAVTVLIICRVTVKWETATACFLDLSHENGIKSENKYAPAILNSSDLSLGCHCNCSQTRDTIPLNVNFS